MKIRLSDASFRKINAMLYKTLPCLEGYKWGEEYGSVKVTVNKEEPIPDHKLKYRSWLLVWGW